MYTEKFDRCIKIDQIEAYKQIRQGIYLFKTKLMNTDRL